MSLTTDTCAICHRAHAAPESSLVTAEAAASSGAAPGFAVAAAAGLDAPLPGQSGITASTICLTCHNGTGAPLSTGAQYAAATPDDPSTASYFSHETGAPTADAADPHLEQFKGALNRRSECTDCHNPHSPTLNTDDPSTETATGWTASGALGLASAVRVTNGPEGAPPAYGWLDAPPATAQKVEREYELCFKCHSGYTTLPSRDPTRPSWWALDKGRELNPANTSYHPVEAPGTNTSPFMDCSLSGTCAQVAETGNTYRLWSTFTSRSTVRCTQCHGSMTAATKPDAGGDLPVHASANRGILIQPYRDRTLKTYAQDVELPADLGDFALCFGCHSTAPFTAVSGNRRSDTAFGIHGHHTSAIATGMNPGTCTDTEIDHAAGTSASGTRCTDGSGTAIGAGSGNAICSECHFRTHSSEFRVGGQGIYTGLVNFAPDVTGVDGKPLGVDAWLKDPIDPQGGSCTLTCHGKVHLSTKY
jgi:hypothetical protein